MASASSASLSACPASPQAPRRASAGFDDSDHDDFQLDGDADMDDILAAAPDDSAWGPEDYCEAAPSNSGGSSGILNASVPPPQSSLSNALSFDDAR